MGLNRLGRRRAGRPPEQPRHQRAPGQGRPGHAERQRDLSLSYEYRAGVLERLGRHGEALPDYRAALAISEKLARSFPDSVMLATTPVGQLAGVVRTGLASGEMSTGAAVALYDRALAILQPPAKAGKLDQVSRGRIEWLHRQTAAAMSLFGAVVPGG